MQEAESTDRKDIVSTTDSPEQPSLRTRLRLGMAWLRQAITEPQRNLDDVQRQVRKLRIGRYSLRHLGRTAHRRWRHRLPWTSSGSSRSWWSDDRGESCSGTASVGQGDHRRYGHERRQIIPPTIDGGDVEWSDWSWLDGIVATASRIDVSTLGWVGMASSSSRRSVMVMIENSFNQICRARTGRSMARRPLVYWCV